MLLIVGNAVFKECDLNSNIGPAHTISIFPNITIIVNLDYKMKASAYQTFCSKIFPVLFPSILTQYTVLHPSQIALCSKENVQSCVQVVPVPSFAQASNTKGSNNPDQMFLSLEV